MLVWESSLSGRVVEAARRGWGLAGSSVFAQYWEKRRKTPERFGGKVAVISLGRAVSQEAVSGRAKSLAGARSLCPLG